MVRRPWSAIAELCRGRLGRLLVLAWPVVLARASQSVIGFCDALMTAPLGESAISATTSGAINTFAVIILPMGTAFIVQSFAAQFQGKGDLLGARRYGWYGVILAAIVGVLAIAVIPAVGPILGLLPYEPEVHGLMTEYIAIRLMSVGPVVAIEALGNWYGGLGNTRPHMIVSLLIMTLNVALNWLLIEGNLGFPALGVQGAAIASVVASWVGFAALGAAFVLPRGARRAPGKIVLRRAELWRMLRFGVPNGVNWFLEFGAFMVFVNVAVAHLGTVVHAAIMVVLQINSVSFMPAFGLTSSGAILIGQAIGRGEHDEVGKLIRLTGMLAATWQCSVGVFYLAIPTVLVGWFEPPTAGGPEMLRVGTTILAISAVWQLFDAWALTLSEGLRAAGDTAWSMWARLILAWVFFIPASLVVVYVFDGGAVLAILCIAAYIAILAAILLWRFASGAWREIDLTGLTGTDALPALADPPDPPDPDDLPGAS